MTTEFNDWIAFTSPGVCPVEMGVMGQIQCADETRNEAERHQVYELSSWSWDDSADASSRVCFYRTVKSAPEFEDWEAFKSPGECPVDGDTLVRVQWRDETREQVEKNTAFEAKSWSWVLPESNGTSIIAFQRVKESKPLDPDWSAVCWNAQHLSDAADQNCFVFDADSAVHYFKKIADALGYDISERGAQ